MFTQKNKADKEKTLLDQIFAVRESFLLLIILLMGFMIYLVNPNFASVQNFRSVSLGISMEGLVVIGMTLVLASGNFDLSVGSIMALSGIVCGLFLRNGFPVFMSILFGVLVGGTVGLLNGFIVAKIGVNALITTLGTMSVTRSITFVISQARPITGFPNFFTKIGQGRFLGIPLPFIYLVIMIVIGDYLLRNSRYLRQIYYLGTNEEAAELSGINTDQIKMFVFTVNGLMAGIAGVIGTSRLNIALPVGFMGAELRIIAGSVIGGASIQGGAGTVLGAILGYVFMALVRNALILLGISVYWQGIAEGALLITAVSLDVWSKKKRSD